MKTIARHSSQSATPPVLVPPGSKARAANLPPVSPEQCGTQPWRQQNQNPLTSHVNAEVGGIAFGVVLHRLRAQKLAQTKTWPTMPPTAADPLKLKAAPGHRAMEAFASVGGGGAGNPAIKFCFPGPTLIQLKKLKCCTVGGFQGMDRPRIPNVKFVDGKRVAAVWQMTESVIACREAMDDLVMGHPGVKLPPHECMARCQDELRKLAALVRLAVASLRKPPGSRSN